jgi:hypothetical protein
VTAWRDGIFAALAALGASMEVAVERTGHDLAASSLVISYAVSISVAVFLVLLIVVTIVLISRGTIP